MKRGNLFWGTLLVGVGVLLLLDGLGYLPFSAWLLLGPIFLIALGLWLVWGSWHRHRLVEAANTVIPLEGASQAALRIRHGAGRLTLGAGAIGDTLLSGSGLGLDCRVRRMDAALEVDLGPREGATVFSWGQEARGLLDWSLSLNGNVPLSLDLECGADEVVLDLHDLRVTELHVKSGASSTRVTLPAAAGHTRARIQVGAAAVDVQVPEGVAAGIHVRGALAGISVDQRRFPRLESDTYRSPDYETAAHRAEIEIVAGAGAVSVH